MYLRYLFFIFVIVFYSCTNQKKSETKLVRFNRNDFKRTSELIAEDLKFEIPLNPFEFRILSDTLILVYTHKHLDFFYELYSLNTYNKIVDFCRKGKGPNEFLSAEEIFQQNNSFIFIKDPTKKRIARYCLDSLLGRNKEYQPAFRSYPNWTKDFTVFAESDKLICYNRWFSDFTNYNMRSSELFYYNGNDVNIKETRYYPANVNGGYIFRSKKNGDVIVANFFDDIIVFYDSDLRLKKILKGPDDYKINYQKANGSIQFEDGNKWRSYYPGVSTKDAIYIIYTGVENISHNDENWRKPVEIFKIGWDGKLLHRYKLNKYVYNLSIDSKEEYFYCSSWNNVKEYPRLLRFKIR
jgi:hypothetical protein